jgi:hypothetical protein
MGYATHPVKCTIRHRGLLALVLALAIVEIIAHRLLPVTAAVLILVMIASDQTESITCTRIASAGERRE